MRNPAFSLDQVKNFIDLTPFPLCTKRPGKSGCRKIEQWLDVGNSQAQKDITSNCHNE